MKIDFIPQNFTPAEEGLLFGFSTESEEPLDVEIEIVEGDDDTVVGIQKLYQVKEGVVNIAPYVTRFNNRKPCVGKGAVRGLEALESMCYKIRIGEVESESIRVSPLRRKVHPVEVVTSMPERREIALGECDEVVLSVEPNMEVEADISCNKESVLYTMVSNDGLVRFLFSPDEFGASSAKADVVLTANGNIVKELEYRVQPRRKRSLRLAWISEAGAIERYTFPMAYSQSSRATKRRIEGCEGVEVVALSAEESVKVVSYHEPRTTIEALSEIVSSPAVWVEVEGELRKVDILTSEVEYSKLGQLDRITLEVRLKREVVVL